MGLHYAVLCTDKVHSFQAKANTKLFAAGLVSQGAVTAEARPLPKRVKVAMGRLLQLICNSFWLWPKVVQCF